MTDHSKVIKEVKSSIAFITVVRPGKISTGSGFVFHKSGILVTCDHVVLDPYDKIFVAFPDMEPDKLIEANVIGRNIKRDVAILEYTPDIERKPLSPYKGEAPEGLPIIFSGYPIGLRTLTTHQGIISSILIDNIGEKTYLIDGTVNPGNSGCPLMSIDGRVIGVIHALQREEGDLLDEVENMEHGLLALHGIDLIEVYQALIKNVQLGIGRAVPCSHIPKH